MTPPFKPPGQKLLKFWNSLTLVHHKPNESIICQPGPKVAITFLPFQKSSKNQKKILKNEKVYLLRGSVEWPSGKIQQKSWLCWWTARISILPLRPISRNRTKIEITLSDALDMAVLTLFPIMRALCAKILLLERPCPPEMINISLTI